MNRFLEKKIIEKLPEGVTLQDFERWAAGKIRFAREQGITLTREELLERIDEMPLVIG